MNRNAKSLAVATVVADALATIPHDWTNPDPTAKPIANPKILTSYANPKTVVFPIVRRHQLGDVHVLVGPSPQTMQAWDDVRDRCRRQWTYEIHVLICQTLGDNDGDIEQPATLALVESLLGFTESMVRFLDEHRSLATKHVADVVAPDVGIQNAIRRNIKLLELQIQTYDADQLTHNHVFASTISATYLVPGD